MVRVIDINAATNDGAIVLRLRLLRAASGIRIGQVRAALKEAGDDKTAQKLLRKELTALRADARLAQATIPYNKAPNTWAGV